MSIEGNVGQKCNIVNYVMFRKIKLSKQQKANLFKKLPLKTSFIGGVYYSCVQHSIFQ